MAASSWIWSLSLAITLGLVNGNSEGDALYTLRRSLSDPDNVLQSWDPTLVNPCTWFHITCNQDNHVTRLSVYHPPSPVHINYDLRSEVNKVGPLDFLLIDFFSLDRFFCFNFHSPIQALSSEFIESICLTVIKIEIKN